MGQEKHSSLFYPAVSDEEASFKTFQSEIRKALQKDIKTTLVSMLQKT
jgi:hypothetical protein